MSSTSGQDPAGTAAKAPPSVAMSDLRWGFNEQDQFFLVCDSANTLVKIRRPEPGVFELRIDRRPEATAELGELPRPIVVVGQPHGSRTEYGTKSSPLQSDLR